MGTSPFPPVPLLYRQADILKKKKKIIGAKKFKTDTVGKGF